MEWEWREWRGSGVSDNRLDGGGVAVERTDGVARYGRVEGGGGG